MRILHVTDFHAREDWYDWLTSVAPSYDLIALTGDMLDMLDFEHIGSQIGMVTAKLSGIRVPLAICSGNHDFWSEDLRLGHADWMRGLRKEDVWIDDDVFTLAGVRIRCIGWNEPLPNVGIGEVWLYHCPPSGSPVSVRTDDDDDFGDAMLEEMCRKECGPELILSGHKHNPQSWQCLLGRTYCFNPGCNLRELLPRYIVIDTVDRTAALHQSGSDTATIRLI